MRNDPTFDFSGILLDWNSRKNTRQMPWKGERDPYRIWLSEIILQQTRVEQGLKYYKDFLKNFPTIQDLAAAPDQAIYKLWEGLGYYSRCRNLIKSARHITADLHGRFPSTYDEIKKLTGVGPYTAAAIASFAFGEPHAVVDGNVFRVLSRIFGISTPIDSTEGRKYFTQLAAKLLDKKKPGAYNQAIMDFGAVVCKPVPLCSDCPFNANCLAYLEDRVSDFPVKSKKVSIRKRWFYYILVERNDKIAIRQRTGKDIWQNLFEFPLIEKQKPLSAKQVLSEVEKFGLPNAHKSASCSDVFQQQLSHQLIQGSFVRIKLANDPGRLKDYTWISKKQISKYPFPKFINSYLATQKL